MIETAILLSSLVAVALILRWCQTMWIKSSQKKWVGFLLALVALLLGWAVLFLLKHKWFHGVANNVIAVMALVYIAWFFKSMLGKVGATEKR